MPVTVLNTSAQLSTKRLSVLDAAESFSGVKTFSVDPIFNNNAIPWAKVNKAGAALSDLSGLLTYAQLPSGAGNWTATPTIVGGLNLTGHFLPSASNTYDLGSTSALWRNAYISQLFSTVFSLNTQTIFGGFTTVSKAAGEFATIVNAADTTIDFGQAMTVNDWVIVRAKDNSGTVKTEYIKVLTLVSGTIYNVTRDLAAAHAPDPTWPSGTPYQVLGTTGDGRIDLLASNGKPRIVFTLQGSAFNTENYRGVIGNLNTYYSYATDIIGAAFGDPAGAWVKIDATNGVRIGHNTTTKLSLDSSGILTAVGIVVTGPDITLGDGTESVFTASGALKYKRHASLIPSQSGDIYGVYSQSPISTRHFIVLENSIKPDTTASAYNTNQQSRVTLNCQGWIGGATHTFSDISLLQIESEATPNLCRVVAQTNTFLVSPTTAAGSIFSSTMQANQFSFPLDISSSTAGQIIFPATQNASAGANTLDDYEEGTWTPVMRFGGSNTNVTYSLQTGRYTKVGRLVCIECSITLTNNGTGTGAPTITGMPFNAGASGASGIVDCIGGFSTLVAGGYVVCDNAGVLYLFGQTTTGRQTLNETNVSDTASFTFSMVYFV